MQSKREIQNKSTDMETLKNLISEKDEEIKNLTMERNKM